MIRNKMTNRGKVATKLCYQMKMKYSKLLKSQMFHQSYFVQSNICPFFLTVHGFLFIDLVYSDSFCYHLARWLSKALR